MIQKLAAVVTCRQKKFTSYQCQHRSSASQRWEVEEAQRGRGREYVRIPKGLNKLNTLI